MPTKSASTFRTSRTERLSYGLYNMGQNLIYSLVNAFIMAFLLMRDLDIAAVAGVMLVVKIWDAINDALFGGIIDKIRFKSGARFMPWLRISLLLIPITTILLYAMPSGLSQTLKLIWLAVAYILWDTAYTICDVPNFGVVTTLTDNLAERTTIMTYGRMLGMVGAMVVTMAFPVLLDKQIGMTYFTAAIAICVVAVLSMSLFVFKGKERVGSTTDEPPISIKQMMQYFVSNKYLLLMSLSSFAINAANTAQTVSLFIGFYLFNSASVATLIGIAMAVPMIVTGFFVPALVRRFGKYPLYMISLGVSLVLGLVTYFVGYGSLMTHIVLVILRGVFFSVPAMLGYMFTPDCAEYGFYKTGVDAKGIAFATQTFFAKLRTAVTSVLGVGILGLFGWQTVSADNFAQLEAMGVTQTPHALQGLWITYALVPMIGLAVGIVILFFYKLRDGDVQLMARFNNGEISREECEAGFKHKF